MNGKALYRERAEILNEIREKAPFFTPEWRYNPENPDAGTALSHIWADMLSETAAGIKLVPEAALKSLLDAIGMEGKAAKRAEGFISFGRQPGLEGACLIPAGTRVLSQGGGEPVLETLKDITLSAAKISGVYEASGEPDCAGRLCSRDGVTLFGFSIKNKRVWSFEHPFAFDVSSGGSIHASLGCGEDTERVAVALTEGTAEWELLTQGGWKRIAAARHGNCLILRCEAGRCTGEMRFSIKDKNAFIGARLDEIRFLPRNARLTPDAVYSGDLPLTEQGFFPFGERFMVYDTLNISCDEALQKPGALVELSFTIRTVRRPIEGYPRPEQEWKPVMRPGEIIKIEEREISVAHVSWEYYNGTGWNALPLLTRGGEAFRAGESPEYRALRFICPEDMSCIAVGANEGCFIRARILAVENAFSMYGYYISPWIENLSFSYGYEKGVQPKRTVSFQNMEEREFFSLHGSPSLIEQVFNEPAVYFEFSEPFSNGTILWELEGAGQRAKTLIWEYRTAAGWETLDVVDGTSGFSRTGLMTYKALASPIKVSLFGTRAFWIRAVIQNGAHMPDRQRPKLTAIWENTVVARALVPGADANRRKGAYVVFASPVSGAASVTNPLPITGGVEAEEQSVTLSRAMRAFSHRQRAVSRWDIECLAMEASPEIIKCRCIPNTAADGSRHVSDISLVIFSRTPQFDELSACVGQYLLSHAPLAHGRLHIVRPLFVALNVSLCAEVSDPGSALAAREEARSRLRSFIDPELGYHDGKGWSIGELPTAAQIQNALRNLKTISSVESLELAYTPLSGSSGADYRQLRESLFTLPENGETEVTIVCRRP